MDIPPPKKPSVLKTGPHFIRRCFMLTGNFEGFYSWRSVTGHAVAITGLVIGAKVTWDKAIKPMWQDHLKPGTQRYVQFLKDEWQGKH